MCGRFTKLYTWKELHRLYSLMSVPADEIGRRFNVAPTQLSPVVRVADGQRRADLFRWGLVPSWSQDESGGGRMINARCETAATNGAFRAAFRKRRCVVPVSGFYEWEKLGDGKAKQPWYFEPADGGARSGESVFSMAGLWEFWKSAAGVEVLTFTIITTTPNELLGKIHDRMPVILPEDKVATWLDPAVEDAAELQSLLVPFPAGRMASSRVSTWVNTPKHDDARCLDACEVPVERGLFG